MKLRSALNQLVCVAFGTAVLMLGACGGGGGSGPLPSPTPSSSPTHSPTPTPTPTPKASPATSTMNVGPGATSAPIPSAGGFGGSVSFPSSNLPTSVSLSATTSLAPPGGIVPLIARHSLIARNPAGSSGMTVYFYESFTSPVPLTFNGIPGFTITLPATLSTSNLYFYVGYFDAGTNAWVDPILGPAAIGGNTLTFAGNPGQTVSLSANVPYTFAFYSLSSPAPTPTPAAIALSPSSIQIDATGATATFTATAASGGTITIASNSTCITNPSTSGVASVSSTSAASGSTFTVTATDAGTCAFTLTDANNDTATETVNIATTTITGQ